MRNAVMGIAAVAATLVFATPQSGATVASTGVPQIGHDSSLVEQVRRGDRGARGGHAYRGGRHAFHSGHFRSHREFRGHHFRGRRHWRGGRWWYGAPVIYGGYGYGYSDDCSWLRRRGIHTGSRYWWRRCRIFPGWARAAQGSLVRGAGGFTAPS